MNWEKVFEDYCEEIRASREFKIKPIVYKGVLFWAWGGDHNVLNLLSFKGTGEEVKFSSVQFEYAAYVRAWWAELFSTGKKVERLRWIDEYVIERNYRVIYADGDIVLRNLKKGMLS